jgi:hypothetical protein
LSFGHHASVIPNACNDVSDVTRLDYDWGEVRLVSVALTDVPVDQVNCSIVLRMQQKNRFMVFNCKI